MKNSIPIIIVVAAVWAIILIPFKIIGYGFMPPDDAMRHSAKVISEKPWDQILVLRDEIKMDSYPGWHAILKVVHKLTGWDQHGLVLFSVISLFVLFCLIPIFFLRYPEAWLLALFALSLIAPNWCMRLFLGRPYIFTMASLLVIFFIWPTLKDKKSQWINTLILVLIVALSVWIHASWYFFLLLIAAFLIAREWQAALILSIASIIGIILGAAFTGHPIIFIKQMVTHLFLVINCHDVERQLVSELKPMSGDFNIVLTAAVILGWRAIMKIKGRKAADDPVFILTALTFILGFFSRRVWIDWGMTAFIVWIAMEFQDFISAKIDPFSGRRAVLGLLSAAIIFIAMTCDAGGRWSLTRPWDYISEEDPQQKAWLPDPGGIIYSDDMGVFYQIFYKNPKADWRYILGFESAFMPPEDLKVLRNIQKNFSRPEDFQAWVRKMRREDRMIVRRGEDSKPRIAGLEWKYVARDTWIGRKSNSNDNRNK